MPLIVTLDIRPGIRGRIRRTIRRRAVRHRLVGLRDMDPRRCRPEPIPRRGRCDVALERGLDSTRGLGDIDVQVPPPEEIVEI